MRALQCVCEYFHVSFRRLFVKPIIARRLRIDLSIDGSLEIRRYPWYDLGYQVGIPANMHAFGGVVGIRDHFGKVGSAELLEVRVAHGQNLLCERFLLGPCQHLMPGTLSNSDADDAVIE